MPSHRWKILAALVFSAAFHPSVALADCRFRLGDQPSYNELVACITDLNNQMNGVQTILDQTGSILDDYQRSLDLTDKRIDQQEREIAALKQQLAALKK